MKKFNYIIQIRQVDMTNIIFSNMFKAALILSSFSIFAGDYIISTSGSYAIQNIIVSSQPSDGTSIIITSSNVTLDLCGNTVIGNSNANLTGVFISPNLANVIVRGGMIYGFSGNGITVSSGCQRIILQDLIIDSCMQRAINCVGTAASPIQDLVIEDCMVSRCSSDITLADFPVNLDNCKNARVAGLTIDQITNTERSISPVRINACSTCILNDLTISSNTTKSLTSLNITGSSQRIFVENAVIQNNSTSGADDSLTGFYGILLDGNGTNAANGNILRNCIVRLNSASGGSLFGISLQGFVQGNLIDECIVEGNNVTTTASALFGLDVRSGGANNSRNIFRNCTINGNSAFSQCTGLVFGNNVGFVSFHIVDDCIFSNNSSANVGCQGILTVSITDSQIKNCKFFGNKGPTDASSFGLNLGVAGLTAIRALATQNIGYANFVTSGGAVVTNQIAGTSVPGATCQQNPLTTSLGACPPWVNIGGIN